MKVSGRQGTWAGPSQSFKLGKDIQSNVEYLAEIWVKPAGSDSKKEKYILTAKIDFASKKDQWIPIASALIQTKQWGKLSGTINFNFPASDVKEIQIYVEGPPKTRDFFVDDSSFKATNPSSGSKPAHKPVAKPKPSQKPVTIKKPITTQKTSEKTDHKIKTSGILLISIFSILKTK